MLTNLVSENTPTKIEDEIYNRINELDQSPDLVAQLTEKLGLTNDLNKGNIRLYDIARTEVTSKYPNFFQKS